MSAVQRALDAFEAKHPEVRCARMRPALVFKRDAGTEIRRLFVEAWWPRALFKPSLFKLIPYHSRLRFQAVHSFDVGEAIRLTLKRDVRGAFDSASDQVLTSAVLASAFGAAQMPLSQRLMRTAAAVTWPLRLQRSDPGWVDLGLESLVVSADRAARTRLVTQPHLAGGAARAAARDERRRAACYADPGAAICALRASTRLAA
jgi:hypothetical protein